jgi:hypothetical protein
VGAARELALSGWLSRVWLHMMRRPDLKFLEDGHDDL